MDKEKFLNWPYNILDKIEAKLIEVFGDGILGMILSFPFSLVAFVTFMYLQCFWWALIFAGPWIAVGWLIYWILT